MAKKKQPRTPKTKHYDLYHLNLLRTAYEKPYTRLDLFKIGLSGAAISGIISFMTLYYWWVSIIFAVFGFIITLIFIIPANTKRSYQTKSWNERNRFVNNYYQLSTNEELSTIAILERLKTRATGEFKEDLSILHSKISTSDPEGVREAFKAFKERYEADTIFMQYVEQIEQSITQGRFNSESLRDLKTFHNDTTKAIKSFINAKNNYFKDLKFIFGLVMVFILTLTFATGFENYVTVFAHHPVGWGVYGIWYLYLLFIVKKYVTIYFDDEVMRVNV